MKIDWQITKKRGNFRPTLNYKIVLEPFEKKLAMHAVWVESELPEIPQSHLGYCLPGENERHPEWRPSGFHRIQVPFFKSGECRGYLRLPFRDSGQYPEVEASFKALRQAYEAVVCSVYGSTPISETGGLEMSRETKRTVAAKVTAGRLLDLFGSRAQPEATRPFRITQQTG